MKWMKIFKAGTHTAMNGATREWSEADLEKIASSYNPDQHEAPIVIGHPKANAPAYGWIDQLKVVGKELLAKPKQVVPEFAELVNRGLYKKRSMSVYPDGTLRHVGFLGAQPPAVKGLEDFAFADDGKAEMYEFEEAENAMPTIEELQQQLADQKAENQQLTTERDQLKTQATTSEQNFAELQAQTKQAEIGAFIDQGIKDGKILPVWKEQGLAQFMDTLEASEETYEFAEGKAKQSPATWFKGFLSSFSEHPLFKEMVVPEDEAKQQTDDFAEQNKLGEEMAALVNPQ